jgi:recombination protein RecA
VFSGERTRLFQEAIAPYLPPALHYKLHPRLRDRFTWQPPTESETPTRAAQTRLVAVPMRIIRKQVVAAEPRERTRFDLQIEGNHTYLADYVVVHNSPETTPGGESLKFYAWSRVRTSRRETLKQGTKEDANETGILTRIKIEKTKLDDSAGGEMMVRIDRVDGLNAAYDIAILGPVLGIVTKSGNALSAETAAGTVKGAGKDAFIAAVKANPAARTELYDKIVAAGIKGGAQIEATFDAEIGEGPDAELIAVETGEVAADAEVAVATDAAPAPEELGVA